MLHRGGTRLESFPRVQLTIGSEISFLNSSILVRYAPDSVFEKSAPLYNLRIHAIASDYPTLSKEAYTKELRPYKDCTLSLSADEFEIVRETTRIDEKIEVKGKIRKKSNAEPLGNASIVLMLIDRQGCIVNTHEHSLFSNENGFFNAQIDRRSLEWCLRSIYFSFFLEVNFKIVLEYDCEEKHHSEEKTAILHLSVKDQGTDSGELQFNLDKLREQFEEMIDDEEEYRWRWSMVPTVRKYREKPSSILTKCEVCGKYVGVGRKRFKQCPHCGRWVGVKCNSCWDSTTVFKRTLCIVCADIHRRSLEAIRANEPKT
jgi:hypothetical protein